MPERAAALLLSGQVLVLVVVGKREPVWLKRREQVRARSETITELLVLLGEPLSEMPMAPLALENLWLRVRVVLV